MSTKTRLEKLERVVTGGNGFCRHTAFIRLIGDATDEERRRVETPEECPECELPRLARVNVIVPTKLSQEAWEAKYSMRGR